MDLKTCQNCHRLFTSVSGSFMCPNCSALVEDKFKEVKQFIRSNPEATSYQVSEACDVSLQQVREWIKEERIEYRQQSAKIGIECEKCGVTITSGRLCEKCKREAEMADKKHQSRYVEDKLILHDKNNTNTNRIRFNSKNK